MKSYRYRPEPSLADTTRAAITMLGNRDKGYVLMVEGGRIDHANHAGNARRALEDTIALDEAVKVAMDMTDRADTLVRVTADHSHTFAISGHPGRGNPILGTVTNGGQALKAKDGKGYTTLGYYLRRAKADFLILDREDGPCGAWRHGWNSLRLFSPARNSSLPGWMMPPHHEGYPTRDDVLAYLRAYGDWTGPGSATLMGAARTARDMAHALTNAINS